MRKLILFGQSDFGRVMMDCVRAISTLEEEDGVYCLDGSDIEQFRTNLNSICNTVYKKDSLLILCDSPNSPLVREAWLVLEKRGLIGKMIMVCGVNVPCVQAALAYKDEIESDEQLEQVLKAQTQSGVTVYRL